MGSLFTSSAFAGDFLAKVSNGALSDTFSGVRALIIEEMKQVKGGYQVLTKRTSKMELDALAFPDNYNKLSWLINSGQVLL
ncbi:hypothetical protein UXU46_01340 [Campylobacter jejuni]